MERIDRIRERIEQTATEAHAYAPITRVISEAEVKEILKQEEKPKTNADRIRSMTDEELALAVMCPADIMGGDTKCDRYGNCRKCALDWLQRESEE